LHLVACLFTYRIGEVINKKLGWYRLVDHVYPFVCGANILIFHRVD